MRSILLRRSRTMAQDEDVGAGREGDGAVWVIFDQDADRHCPYLTKRCGSSMVISGISDPLIWFSNVFGVEEGIFHGVSRTLKSWWSSAHRFQFHKLDETS